MGRARAAEAAAGAAPPAPARRPPRAAGWWWPVGRVAGIAVFVSPVLPLALGALLTLGGPWPEFGARALAAGALLLGVIVHEAGHALAARRRGLALGGVYLHLVSFAHVGRGRPQDEWRVALAGPLASLLVGALGLGVAGACGELAGLAADPARGLDRPLVLLAGVNLLMAALNLVPVLPADGGRALRALLRVRISARGADRVLGGLGLLLGLGLLGAGAWVPWLDDLWVRLLGVGLAWAAVRAWTGRPQINPPAGPPAPRRGASAASDPGA